MFVTDASLWIANYRPQDRHHAAASRWIEEAIARGEHMIGPSLLLAEVAGALARITGDPAGALETVESMRRLPEIEIVVESEQHIDLTWRLAGELRLKGGDATYVALAAQLDLTLVTFDEEQRERANQRVRTTTPTVGGFE